MSEEGSSLVELTAVEEITNMCRLTKDELDELVKMFKLYSDEKSDLRKLYERVRNLKNQGEELYLRTMQYLVKSIEIAMFISTYINIVKGLDRAIQDIDAVAYRVYLARESNVIFDKGVIDTFIKVLEIEMRQIDKLEEALSKIKLSPKVVLEKLGEVFVAEEEVDTIYRKSMFEIYTRYSGYIPALLILKDIFERLEDISDYFKSVAEELRFLALARRG
ncbi:MAG: DUF47 family protein [Desulfurococcaceae archaeon]|nr:DUF47 family protein [Desulfurococcaceae archaeon]